MKLLTAKLNEPVRSMTRFTIVGLSGTAIQYGWYYLFLYLFHRFSPDMTGLVNVAFTIGYVLEMISNYLLQSYYVFETRPQWKNLGGFVSGRIVNYLLQMLLLYCLMLPQIGMNEKWAGFLAIFIAGIVNYFVLKIFFKKK
ncbi:MAG: GtrA family protein [Paludibacteraceae bacterium]|nr:GtrA family protein [Paludibacteraceae bacterium]